MGKENPRDGGAWWAAIYGVTQSQTWLKWLSSSSSKNLLLPFCYFFSVCFVDSLFLVSSLVVFDLITTCSGVLWLLYHNFFLYLLSWKRVQSPLSGVLHKWMESLAGLPAWARSQPAFSNQSLLVWSCYRVGLQSGMHGCIVQYTGY